MCCFVAPAAEAAIVTIANIVIEHHSKKEIAQGQSHEVAIVPQSESKLTSLHTKLKGLSRLLWGGSALLAFEHLWHGEIQPFYPFLTAASDPTALNEALHEMATVGTSMAAFVTLSWAAFHLVKSKVHKNQATPATVKVKE